MRRWLIASASAGSSVSVGMNDVLQRIVGSGAGPPSGLGFGEHVGPGPAGPVDEPLHGSAAEEVRLDDLRKVLGADARVPHVLRVDDEHGPVPALGEAPRLVDPDLDVEAGPGHLATEVLDEALGVALRRTRAARRAHEDVALVLAHYSSGLAGYLRRF